MTALEYATAIGSGFGSAVLQWSGKQLAPIDPLYETYTSSKSGKAKQRRRPLPDGLTRSERKALTKVRLRAHFLDEGDSVKPHRFESLNVKWHRFLVDTGVLVHGRQSIIEVTGDVKDVLLYYAMIMRPAMAVGIPFSLRHRMLLNYALAHKAPSMPLIGKTVAQAIKPNSRNALLFEDWLIRRALARQNKPVPKTAASTGANTPAADADAADKRVEVEPATKELLLVEGVGDTPDDGDDPAPASRIATVKVSTAKAQR